MGVQCVVSGYACGRAKDPTYEQVCSGSTGHAEVVQVRFDPAVISYRQLLEVFFTIHDPTTPDQQGADRGTQYRSIVLWHDAAQRGAAEEAMREVEAKGVWDAPLVTQLQPFEGFWAAEEHHQHYFRRNPWQPYCAVVVRPKVAKFRKEWAGLLR
ncbi:MAG: peptide-methionine (S)-S-oxide reductase MsrA [Halobacteriales archaeon]|nr:peptide-methionine (S)-S-oxide reductase MsrA [Halobacteriales archaeon]